MIDGLDHVQLAAPRGGEDDARRFYGGVLGLAEALAAAGHPVEWDTNIPERRRFYTADPFGNRLELTGPATA